jgi:hypothetical protein
MFRWEYKSVFKDIQVTDDNITSFLNEEGNDGWELVNIIFTFGTFHAIFKRSKAYNSTWYVMGADYSIGEDNAVLLSTSVDGFNYKSTCCDKDKR